MDYRKKFRVKPGEKLRLNKLDPAFTGEHESEAIAKEETEHYLTPSSPTSKLCSTPSTSTRS